MQFDWEQLRPEWELSEAYKTLIRAIGENFLSSGTGLPDQQKRIELGKNRRLLDELAQYGFITNISNKYYPTFQSLFFLPEKRDYGAEATDLVFRAFQSLYKKNTHQKFTVDQVSAEASLMKFGSGVEMAASVGMLFARDFQKYLSNFEHSKNIPIVSAYATENILDYENLQQAWQEEIELRPRPQPNPRPAPSSQNYRHREVRPLQKASEVKEGEAPTEKQDRTTILGSESSAPSLPEETRSKSDERPDSIGISSISDSPTGQDALGFKPYVEAISRFLLSPETKPPLTLSIEGEWGSGKSSFMLQLRNSITGPTLLNRLKSARKSNTSPSGRKRTWHALWQKQRITVQFNPWRHDKESSLWAAFALEFLRQVSRQRSLFRRVYGNAHLFFAHYNWKGGWFEVLRAATIWLLATVLLIGLPVGIAKYKPRWAEEAIDTLTKRLNNNENSSDAPSLQKDSSTAGQGSNKEKTPERKDGDFDPVLRWLLLVGGNAANFAVALTIWLKVKDIVGNPAEINIKRYLRSPDYEGRVAFVEQFHADFRKIVDAYAGKEKVFVFVDDLDRCEVPKAAELMKAINLLISDDERLIFIVGMDREKVAAGLAVKYEKLLPYLIQGELNDGKPPSPRDGLAFGQTFLQKFVQLPFRVPEPNPEEYENFIRTISVPHQNNRNDEGSSIKSVHRGTEHVAFSKGKALTTDAKKPSTPRHLPPDPDQIQIRLQRELQFQGDSDNVREVGSMFAQTLGRNPRRMKQFMNLFRLQAYIANEIGLFDTVSRGKARTALTLQQLGKFVAISLRWPGLLAEFAEDQKLLGRLEEFATNNSHINSNPTESDRGWLLERRLRSLLTFGVPEGKPEYALSDYTMSNPLIYQLLHICPQRIRTSESIEQEDSTAKTQ